MGGFNYWLKANNHKTVGCNYLTIYTKVNAILRLVLSSVKVFKHFLSCKKNVFVACNWKTCEMKINLTILLWLQNKTIKNERNNCPLARKNVSISGISIKKRKNNKRHN